MIAAAGAYVVSLATPSRYRSAETLIYLPAGGTTDVDSDTATRDLQTAVGLVQAAPVLGPAAAKLGVSQDELRSSVTAALPTDSNLIRIEATAATASDAQKRALMVAKSSSSSGWACSAAPSTPASTRSTRRSTASMAKPTSDSAATIRNLRDQLSLAQSDRAVANGDFAVGDPARVPKAAFQPQPARNVVLGAVAGLLIGIAAAFGRARLNRRLITIDDVEAAYGMPAIGAIPPPGFHEVDGAGHIIGDFEGSSPLVEAFRSTRATLSLYSVGNGEPTVIAVTSANGGEGKTTVVANLGLAMATSGKRVLAISADLRKPSLYAFFPEASRAGLLDVLSGKVPLSEATGWVSLNGSSASGGQLGMLATSSRFRDPARLFESADIALILDQAREDYDVILIDAPPLLQTPEASIIAGMADANLIVGRAGSLTRDDARRAMERLNTANAKTLGVIVSDARERRASYGYGNEDEAHVTAQVR